LAAAAPLVLVVFTARGFASVSFSAASIPAIFVSSGLSLS
jgi:hypothetical protein